MRRKLVSTLAIATAAIGLGTIGVVEAGAKPVKTKGKLSLSYFPESQTRTYLVRVKSDKDSCKSGRTVVYFEKLDGPDNQIGTATSTEFGGASFVDSPQPPFAPGDIFYAKVLKKGNQCAAAKTKNVVVAPSR